jgi:hypothetical protein
MAVYTEPKERRMKEKLKGEKTDESYQTIISKSLEMVESFIF